MGIMNQPMIGLLLEIYGEPKNPTTRERRIIIMRDKVIYDVPYDYDPEVINELIMTQAKIQDLYIGAK